MVRRATTLRPGTAGEKAGGEGNGAASMLGPVRVVIIDDHEIIRTGLRTLLSRESDIEILATAGTGEEGLRLIKELKPHVAVVDYSLPKMSGISVCEAIVKHHPNTAVIVLTAYLDDTIVRRALSAGARAYVYKDVEAKDLKKAIRTVVEGGSILDPKVAGKVMKWAQKRYTAGVVARSKTLSIREVEVLRLVAQGASNQEIADQLNLGRNTVKTYVQRSLLKLECHSRAEAAAVASKWGLL